ncbi:MAG TPA: hypothetical protein VIV27_09280, partial [Halioglobus sp.]
SDCDLVAFTDCGLIGINNSLMLVINRQNGNQQMMTPQVVEGLKTCSTFRTVDAHAAHLANTRAELQGQQAMAATALNTLKAAGMLLRARDVCAKLAQVVPRQLPPTRVFIITSDRPAAVQRLLDSLLGVGKLNRHDALFLIDDSRERANRDANREAVATFNLHSARTMFYVGAQAQQALMSGLIEKLPSHTAGIHFLLDPSLWQGKKTFGRSRNLCLLLSVGYRALVMDDDILCQAILSPLTEEGIGIGSGGMREATFYVSEQELWRSGKPADFDPLSEHASVLGSTLGCAMQRLNGGPLRESQLHNVNAALANVLTADSPILVTQCGSLGDPGTGGTHWALFQSEATVRRMISAPHGLTAAIESRLNWLGSTRPNFYKIPFMSQLTGLDNSQLLPPYFPAFRGEDALFGAMLASVHRRSMAFEFPWSVPHLPLEARACTMQDPIAYSGDIGLFARYLGAHIDYKDGTDPAYNLDSLARDITRMASRSDSDLLLDFRAELARAHADQLYRLADQSTRTEKFQSPELQDYLSRGINEIQRTLSISQSPTNISGMPVNMTETQLLAQFRELARGFAAALAGWVEIRTVAATLTDGLISAGDDLLR